MNVMRELCILDLSSQSNSHDDFANQIERLNTEHKFENECERTNVNTNANTHSRSRANDDFITLSRFRIWLKEWCVVWLMFDYASKINWDSWIFDVNDSCQFDAKRDESENDFEIRQSRRSSLEHDLRQHSSSNNINESLYRRRIRDFNARSFASIESFNLVLFKSLSRQLLRQQWWSLSRFAFHVVQTRIDTILELDCSYEIDDEHVVVTKFEKNVECFAMRDKYSCRRKKQKIVMKKKYAKTSQNVIARERDENDRVCKVMSMIKINERRQRHDFIQLTRDEMRLTMSKAKSAKVNRWMSIIVWWS